MRHWDVQYCLALYYEVEDRKENEPNEYEHDRHDDKEGLNRGSQ